MVTMILLRKANWLGGSLVGVRNVSLVLATRLACFTALISFGVAHAATHDFDTPEHTIKTFQDAFVRGDTTVALAAWDFSEAARLIQRTTIDAPPGFFDEIGAAKDRKYLARALKDSLLEQMRGKVVARFAASKCELTRKETFSVTLVRLSERCTVENGKEYSQQLVAKRGSAGWRIAEYPTLRFYDPVCFSDAPSGIDVCSERDGQHVSATKGGRELWRKDSVRDWQIRPYRTIYPVIVSIRRSLRTPQDLDLGNGTLVVVRYDSSEFGKFAVQTGAFRFLGQD